MGQLRAAVIPVTPFQQNCTILWDEASGDGVVIDPGGEVDRIMAAVQRAGAMIERIWLTHGHLDHAGGAAELRDALNGVPIEGPERHDEFLLQNLEHPSSADVGEPSQRVTVEIDEFWIGYDKAVTE